MGWRSGGIARLIHATERWPIDVLTVDREGELTATPGFLAMLART